MQAAAAKGSTLKTKKKKIAYKILKIFNLKQIKAPGLSKTGLWGS